MSLRRKYSIADVFSLGGLALSFFSVQQSIAGAPGMAAELILLALLMDLVDGRLSRMFGPSIAGKELDSFSDFASAGIATPVLLYTLYPQWLPVFVIFPICSAMRLASFNLQDDSSYFVGIPTFISSMLAISLYKSGLLAFGQPPALALLILIPLSMISWVKLSSFKTTRMAVVGALALAYVVVFALSEELFWPVLAAGSMAYVVIGMVDQMLCGNLFPIISNRVLGKTVELGISGHKIVLFRGVHPPSKDSVFMYETLKGRLSGSVLEIGTGTGLIPVMLGSNGTRWTCTDVSVRALENAKLNLRKNGIEARILHSNIFDGIEGSFDAIIWNFPFLLGSREMMTGFVCGVKKHLKKRGMAIILSSSLMKLRYPEFERDCERLGLRSRVVANSSYLLVPIHAYELTLR